MTKDETHTDAVLGAEGGKEDSETTTATVSNGTDAARQTARDEAREAAHLPDEWNKRGDPEASRRRYLLGRYWYSARGFWGKGGDRFAWPLSVGVVALILLALAAQYGVNLWNRVTFDALEKRMPPRFSSMPDCSCRWCSPASVSVSPTSMFA